MARPFETFPEPYLVKLGRICLAQVVVSVSALASTCVLLSCVVVVLKG